MKRSQAIKTISSYPTFLKYLGLSSDQFAEITNNLERYYYSFSVPKIDGSNRIITPPNKLLRQIHANLLELLYAVFTPFPKYVCGGIKNRSIFEHASPHTQKKCVITLDINSFFPSTTKDIVSSSLEQRVPTNVSEWISDLCTYENALPQGSPTSMILANIVLLSADKQVSKFCKKHDFSYTRYVDDIALSANYDLLGSLPHICSIIENSGYSISSKKTRVMNSGQRQIITGLCVNDIVRPTNDFIARVKRELWRGIEITPEVAADELGLNIGKYKASLNGKVNFIKQFHPKKAEEFKGLLYKLWA